MSGLIHPPTEKAFFAGSISHRRTAPGTKNPSRFRNLAAKVGHQLRNWLLRLSEVGF